MLTRQLGIVEHGEEGGDHGDDSLFPARRALRFGAAHEVSVFLLDVVKVGGAPGKLILQ